MNKKQELQLLRPYSTCLMLSAFMLLTIGTVDAYAGGALGTAMCQIPVSVISTSLGRAIATIGIIILGVMATLGRITWTQAVVVGVGISVIFGAAALAGTLSMGSGVDCVYP